VTPAQTFAEVLPLAIAIAASPFPILPAILLLLTPAPRLLASAFLAGWASGILVATIGFAALAAVVDDRGYPPTWAAWLVVILGLALVAIGVAKWRGRRADRADPAWLASIAEATPPRAIRLGLLLSAANPKVLLLVAAAGLVIGSADLGTAPAVAVVAAFTVLASVSVALPLLLFLVLGDRVLEPLLRARAWLTDNNEAVMSVVLTVIGGYLIANGIAGL